MKLFEPHLLRALVRELRGSLRGLLANLCTDLETHYPVAVAALRVPVEYFRFVSASLWPEDFSHWRVVGWIEALNDLVYFVDVAEQLRRERDRTTFAEELLAACREQFYEHGYVDELFPRGEPQPAGLSSRVARVCARLAQEVTQESLFLIPGLPCAWLRRTGRSSWAMPCDLREDFERAELPGCVSVGLDGAYVAPPSEARQWLARRGFAGTFIIRPSRVELRGGRAGTTVMTGGSSPQWVWRYVPPFVLRPQSAVWPVGLTLGPTLVYSRRDRTPVRVVPSNRKFAERIDRALRVIEAAWPAGASNLACLTTRIVPLRAPGVVSYSYRHRPGVSFLNLFERNQLDLVDDLIHENSHHHMNLLLRKYAMRRGDQNQEIFYSAWRRSLRPLHGILHATFTFTMGALLFERLSAWQAGHKAAWRQGGLTERDGLRARFRCLEEVESVRYSIEDLLGTARARGWLTPAGVSLVQALQRELTGVRRRIAPSQSVVMRSRYGKELAGHIADLVAKRRLYRRPERTGSG
jgi:HEXXH motif-containing protein